MAQTLEQLTQQALGAAHFKILSLLAQCGQQQEEIERLKAQIPKPEPPA